MGAALPDDDAFDASRATRARKIGTAKHDARVGRRRTQRHVDLFSRVQANARRANDVLERALFDHFSF